jgi:RNA polymerase sigma factor (TIGR02999 family)
MSDVTRILSALKQGDAQAARELLPVLYTELRRLAAQKLAREAPGHTLNATALVHEASLRLVDVDKVQHWDSRRHFFAAAAEAMRRILVESARRKQRLKHGGGRVRGPEKWDIACSVSPVSRFPRPAALHRHLPERPRRAAHRGHAVHAAQKAEPVA